MCLVLSAEVTHLGKTYVHWVSQSEQGWLVGSPTAQQVPREPGELLTWKDSLVMDQWARCSQNGKTTCVWR